MDREQMVEALRRQIDEDYRLDIAALERLRGRHNGDASATFSSAPSTSAPAYAAPGSNVYSAPSSSSYSAPSSAPGNAYAMPSKWSEESESRVEPASPASAPADDQRDQHLVGSLRTMFTSGRK